MKVVLDTSVIIDYLRQGGMGTGNFFLELVEQEVEMEMSAVTVAELYVGKTAQTGGKQRRKIDEIIGGVIINSPSLEMAKLVGEIRYKFKLSLQDAFVAALAMNEDLPVVSRDKKAFGRVPGIRFYNG
ncbi:MAG: hypothetical protein G01um101416_1134 [Microgenomates group bacterium Gr01-1014_16]|nr:MAG: hypothetical protein G01um101416_1134 [Microgenomates group bacterium Gr01-1014_16]